MKINTSRKAGFTLVEIMIVVAIIGLLAAIAIPNFVKARNTSQSNACVNNMRQIDSGIQQWALENGKKDTDPVTTGDVAPYIKAGFPVCPSGQSAYALGGTVGATPSVTCPNASLGPPVMHTLP